MQTIIRKIENELTDRFEDYEHDFTNAIKFYINELEEKAEDYENIQDVVADFSHGCSSGIVSGLIYYSDTLPFFAENKTGIAEILNELQDGCGMPWTDILNGFDKEDIFCDYENNQNLLAWFLFEYINSEAERIFEDIEEED